MGIRKSISLRLIMVIIFSGQRHKRQNIVPGVAGDQWLGGQVGNIKVAVCCLYPSIVFLFKGFHHCLGTSTFELQHLAHNEHPILIF